MAVKAIPAGYHTLTPSLTVKDGAKALMLPSDMFWGDRFGTVEDPSGHRWGLATHVEDLSPEEMGKRQQEFFASMGQGKK